MATRRNPAKNRQKIDWLQFAQVAMDNYEDAKDPHMLFLVAVNVLNKDAPRKSFEMCLASFEKLAEDDDNKLAQTILGQYYYFLPRPSYVKALYWLEKAANNKKKCCSGLPEESEYNLCLDGMYVLCEILRAEDSGQPPEKVFKYHKMFADKFNRPAPMFWVSKFYLDGEGVEQDYYKAFAWAQKAAAFEVPQCLDHLGLFYLEGWGVEKDEKQAIEYFKEAARQGDPIANFHVGECYCLGRGGESDFDKGVSYLLKSAEGGYPPACLPIGTFYARGLHLEKNLMKAKHFLTIALKAGLTDAKEELNDVKVELRKLN